MKSKIKTAELRDVVQHHPITAHNDATGLPSPQYGTAQNIYAKVRLTLASIIKDDKSQVVHNYTITTRIDSRVYNIDDKIVYNGKTMYIKSIDQLDIWFQNLVCYYEY